NAAFALFEPIRVPRKIVVQNRVKMVLQVDAFAEAICGNQHTALSLNQDRNGSLPLFVASGFPRHGSGPEGRIFVLNALLQLFGYVLCCGDESAEKNGMVSLLEPVKNDLGSLLYLGVLIGRSNFFCTLKEFLQLGPVRLGEVTPAEVRRRLGHSVNNPALSEGIERLSAK